MNKIIINYCRQLNTKNIVSSFKEEGFRKLFRNVMTLLIGDVGTAILGIITMAITVKALGLEKYGWLILIQTYILTVDSLLNFQSWQGLIKYGAEAIKSEDKSRLKSYIRQSVIFDVVTAILGAIVAFFCITFVGDLLNWNQSLIDAGKIYSLTILSHITGTPIGILRLYGKFKLISVQKIIIAVLKLITVAIAYFSDASFVTIVIIYLIMDSLENIFLILIGAYILHKNNIKNWWKYKLDKKKDFFQFVFYSNITNTLDVPVKQLDVFIISALISAETVGIYKIFKSITNVFTKISNPIYQAVYPQLASYVADGDQKEAEKITIKIGLLILLLGVPISLLASVTSKWWLSLFFGGPVSENWVILVVFLFIKLISVSFVALHPLFIAVGLIKYNVPIMVISNVIYFASAWLLGANFGLIGIIVAYGIQFSIVITIKFLLLKKNR